MIKKGLFIFVMTAILAVSVCGYADDIVSVRLYFGLCLSDGRSISLSDWASFEEQHIAKAFEGYTIVESTGAYKGVPEWSKVATIVLKESEIPKAKNLAKCYAKKFSQKSVMMTVSPISQWEFIGAEE
jgi:hypothetical protein